MAALNIWFNRTYATSYWLMRQLRANPDDVPVRIWATHPDPDSPTMVAADVTEPEPDLTGEAYVRWALDFCRRHEIRLLFVRNQQLTLASASARFEALGTTLVTPPAETVALFEDKAFAYRAVEAAGLAVPPWRTADSAAALGQAHTSLLAELGDADAELVLKPTRGVGAAGFRILTSRPRAAADFAAELDPRVDLAQVLGAYERAEQAGAPRPELLLMPRLSGPEISVDTLHDRNGRLLLDLPRVKVSPRVTRFTAVPPVAAYVRELQRLSPFRYLSNAQFMWWRGQPALLEVNTRPAGGLFATSQTGLNLPWEAARLALGYSARPLHPRLGGAYVKVELPVALSSD